MDFPAYLPFKGERTYSIVGYIQDGIDYQDNKGYIDEKSGKIYICSRFNAPCHLDVPILYVNEDGSINKKKEVLSPQTKEIFRKEYLYKLDVNGIINNTGENEELYNEEALADMNAATSVFVPIINENDDPLKKLIKQAIIDKKIDINRLKHKMPQKYGLTNMKSALIGKTKMSISNFNIWCELLGISYYIELGNNGTDNINPLPHPIWFSSEEGIGQ